MKDFDLELNTFELTIVKNGLGYLVYRKGDNSILDIFPDTDEGCERLLKFVAKQIDYEKPINE